MIFPENPVNGQTYQGYYFDSAIQRWRKNSNVAVISEEGQEFLLPSDPKIGDTVRVIVRKHGINSHITQPENTNIIYDHRHTTIGSTGKLRLKPYQALSLTQIGDVVEHADNTGPYPLSPNQIAAPGAIKTMAVSPNSEYLAVSYEVAPKVSVYKLNRTTKAYENLNLTLSSTLDILALSWSHDSKYLAMALTHAPYLSIFEITENSFDEILLPNRPATGPGHIDYSIAWSPTDHYLIEGHARAPYVTIYDLRDKNAITEVPITLSGLSIVYTVEFSPNGQWFAVGHTGRSSKLDLFAWNDGVPTKIPFTFSRSSEIRFMSWSPDSNSLALINNGKFQIIDWSTGTPVLSTRTNVVPSSGYSLVTLGWSPNSKRIVVSQKFNQNQIGFGNMQFYGVEIGGATSVDSSSAITFKGVPYATQWTPSGELFMVANNLDPYFQIYDSGDAHENAWQLIHLDGPAVGDGDFE